MGITKSEIFTDQQNELALLAKVLGHPARIAILQHLIRQDKCVCGHLVNVIGLSQSTISQHLKELKNSGLIQGNVEGTSVCYCLDVTRWEEAKNLITSFFQLPKGCC